MHALQEHAALGTLNNAVVVRARHRDDFGNAECIQVGFVRTLELCGVINASHTNNHALTRHKARHGLHCADCAGIGDGDICALEVSNGEFVVLDLANDLVISNKEACEVECVCITKNRHDEVACAVTLVNINSKSDIDMRVANDHWLAGFINGKRIAHVGNSVGDSANNGVRDDVRE